MSDDQNTETLRIDARILLAGAVDRAAAAADLRRRLREIAAAAIPEVRTTEAGIYETVAAAAMADVHKAAADLAELDRYLGESVGIDLEAEAPYLAAAVRHYVRWQGWAHHLKWLIANAATELAAGRRTARQAARMQLGAMLTLAQHLGVVPPNLASANELLDALADLDRGRVAPILEPLPRPTFGAGERAGQPIGGAPPRIGHAELDDLCLAAAAVTCLVQHGGYRLNDAAAHVAGEMTRRGAVYTARRIKKFRAGAPIDSGAVARHIKAAAAIDDRIAERDARKAAGQSTAWAATEPETTLWAGPAPEGEDHPFVAAGAAPTERVTTETAAGRTYDGVAHHIEDWYRRYCLEAWLPAREAALLAVELILNRQPTFAALEPLPEIVAILDRSDAAAAPRSG